MTSILDVASPFRDSFAESRQLKNVTLAKEPGEGQGVLALVPDPGGRGYRRGLPNASTLFRRGEKIGVAVALLTLRDIGLGEGATRRYVRPVRFLLADGVSPQRARSGGQLAGW